MIADAFISWPVAFVFIGVGLLIGVALAIRELIRRQETLPYVGVASLLSESEQKFFHVLRAAAHELPVHIVMKVRLLDLLHIPRGTGEHGKYRAKVQSKHVDFVLLDRDSLRPLLVIELDDPTHRRRDRMARDAFVDAAFAQARIPIRHIPTAGKYDEIKLRTLIRDAL
jgi:hypothetical protein